MWRIGGLAYGLLRSTKQDNKRMDGANDNRSDRGLKYSNKSFVATGNLNLLWRKSCGQNN